jgi:hypothetical protein
VGAAEGDVIEALGALEPVWGELYPHATLSSRTVWWSMCIILGTLSFVIH